MRGEGKEDLRGWLGKAEECQGRRRGAGGGGREMVRFTSKGLKEQEKVNSSRQMLIQDIDTWQDDGGDSWQDDCQL